jgi:transposase
VYPTDVTDAQWAVIDRLLPDPAWMTGRGGRREKHCRRLIVDAILYVVDNGIKWRALPADFPPWPTVYKRFVAWEKAGATHLLLAGLGEQVRLTQGRVPTPSAAVIDSQSVRAASTVSRTSRGYDAGKKVNGRKRHIAVDTLGLLLAVLVTPASTRTGPPRPACCDVCAAQQGIGCFWSGPTAATPEPSSNTPGGLSAWSSRSLNDPTYPGSPCYPDVGSSNAPSRGSPATDAAQETTNVSHTTTKP